MEEKYQAGDFGDARFKFGKGITRFRGYGTILHIDGDYIVFKDNDDFQYHIRADEFNFTKKDFNSK